MQAGRLRTKLIIQEKIRKPDGQGGFSEIWAEFCQVYGRQIVRKADAVVIADQTSSVQMCRFETRFVDGVSPKMRALINTRVFEIEAVYDPSQKRERLVLDCTELQNSGV